MTEGTEVDWLEGDVKQAQAEMLNNAIEFAKLYEVFADTPRAVGRDHVSNQCGPGKMRMGLAQRHYGGIREQLVHRRNQPQKPFVR